jgi:hypothetical protein
VHDGFDHSFSGAPRLISCVATASESDDGGDSLGRMLLEIANGDAVGAALACAHPQRQSVVRNPGGAGAFIDGALNSALPSLPAEPKSLRTRLFHVLPERDSS